MSKKDDKFSSSSQPDPLDTAVKTVWLHAAVTDPTPDGMSECWQCHQWRPEKTGSEIEENEPCPHCGAVWVAF